MRPFVSLPQNDLWERQRVFNLILLDVFQHHLQEWRDHQKRVERLFEQRIGDLDHRTRHLENFLRQGLDEVMRHDDALFGRVDRKLDRYRREADELAGLLRAALARGPEAEKGLREADADVSYIDFEHRFRGAEEDIRDGLRVYLPRLLQAAPVLDLGCGRGEALALLEAEGVECRGVDPSSAMVRHCREQGFGVDQNDALTALVQTEPASLGGVVSFHVIEHLAPEDVECLVRLAFTALRPGGILVLETPNPLSVAVTARSFWLDPTHKRPVHPEALSACYEQAGFTGIERLDLRPYPEEERLPEIPLDGLEGQNRELADRLNRLRDELDDFLFGYRDYALIGLRPER